MVRATGNSAGESGNRDIEEEVWNWYCYDCRWRGVAQELKQDFDTEEGWVCHKCDSTSIEDRGWNRGDKKWT